MKTGNAPGTSRDGRGKSSAKKSAMLCERQVREPQPARVPLEKRNGCNERVTRRRKSKCAKRPYQGPLPGTVIHGKWGTKVYQAWAGMLQRCYNDECSEYHRYGGRGIRVAKLYHSFPNFYRDLGDPPGPEYSLDRIDPAGHYEPGNLRWADPKTQAINQRNTVRYSYQGKKLTLMDWSRETGIPYFCLYNRVRLRDWDIEDALETPARKWGTNRT